MSSTSDKTTGQVKWFNNKTGYGFITVNDGEHKGKDIFTHYSAISVNNSQYKYLVQGEYVELGLIKPETGEHEYQAVDVSGIKGGQLMCEVRFSQQSSSRGKPTKGKRSTSVSESQQDSA
jgi:cold shock CspA family protein